MVHPSAFRNLTSEIKVLTFEILDTPPYYLALA